MAKKTMKKKAMKKKVQSKSAADKLAGPVLDSAREIWLAGLGAFNFAQSEGGKVIDQGNKLFEKLVAEGKKLDKKTRGVAGSAVEGLRDEVGSKVGQVRRQASDNWDRLEGIFEDRVARVMGQLGVPTAEEISHLTERVHTLSLQVVEMTKAAAKQPATKKATTKKPTAKKAAAKKPAAKKTASKKATAKTPAPKKAAPKPAAPMKADAKKADAKKVVAKKASSKKAASNKPASKKATSKKAAAKK